VSRGPDSHVQVIAEAACLLGERAEVQHSFGGGAGSQARFGRLGLRPGLVARWLP